MHQIKFMRRCLLNTAFDKTVEKLNWKFIHNSTVLLYQNLGTKNISLELSCPLNENNAVINMCFTFMKWRGYFNKEANYPYENDFIRIEQLWLIKN